VIRAARPEHDPFDLVCQTDLVGSHALHLSPQSSVLGRPPKQCPHRSVVANYLRPQSLGALGVRGFDRWIRREVEPLDRIGDRDLDRDGLAEINGLVVRR
jgi:hypothetical protein